MTIFIPYIESHLSLTCRQPIFARIATHSMRKIEMSKSEHQSEDHLQYAYLKVRQHYADYKASTISERFPIDRYHYFIAPELAWHISLEGKTIGIFRETECKPKLIFSE